MSTPFRSQPAQQQAPLEFTKKTSHAESFDYLPDEAFIREKRLLESGLVPFSSATLWRRVKSGDFPKPIKLEPHITAWRVGDVRAKLASYGAPAATTKKRRA